MNREDEGRTYLIFLFWLPWQNYDWHLLACEIRKLVIIHSG